jgi:UDP-N-acetylglucosamine/UDP-N-acetylgalactosamine diphosphorylase
MHPVAAYTDRGVKLHNPGTITLEVSPDQMGPGVEIFPGCCIRGAQTSIGPGCRIGSDGPVTIVDCQLGEAVGFASGFAERSTFLDGVTIGANAHIRPGTLLEEEVTLAHCVGLKQTLLLPFVTLGSLINFCDCLMAGGTSRSHHSEVGSSFIHFNFTPRQDKATASLFGDIPRGVLLNQSPIFLGGQGGVVGPVRMAYGTIQAAGSISRKDMMEADSLMHPPVPAIAPGTRFDPGKFGNIERVVGNNCHYIGNLLALRAWYREVRTRTMSDNVYTQACLNGAMQRLNEMLEERVKQLRRMAEKVQDSSHAHVSHERLQTLLQEAHIAEEPALTVPADLVAHIVSNRWSSHIACIQAMPERVQQVVQDWLHAIVNVVVQKWEETQDG